MLPPVGGHPCTAAAGGLEVRSLLILLRCSDGEKGLLGIFFLGQLHMILIVTGSLYYFCLYLFVHMFTSLCRDFQISIQCRLLLIVL